VKPRREPGLFW